MKTIPFPGPGFASLVFLLLLSPGRAFSATAYDTLEENYQKWKDNRPHEYAFTYGTACYCQAPVWRVKVEADSVTRVTNISPTVPGTPSAPGSYSMDSVFARIKAGLDKRPAHYEIRYDSRWGYPATASFDPVLAVADDEYTVYVSDFIGPTPMDTLAFNYAKWKAHRPDRYAYTYLVGIVCSCVYPVWRVEAHGDSVVSVTHRSGNADTSRPNADLQYYSMDSLFARIRKELDSDPDIYEIRYDDRLGYPSSAGFYPDTRIMDAGHSYQVSELTDLTVSIRASARPSRGRSGMGSTGAGPDRAAEGAMSRDLRGRKGPGSASGPVFDLPR